MGIRLRVSDPPGFRIEPRRTRAPMLMAKTAKARQIGSGTTETNSLMHGPFTRPRATVLLSTVLSLSRP